MLVYPHTYLARTYLFPFFLSLVLISLLSVGGWHSSLDLRVINPSPFPIAVAVAFAVEFWRGIPVTD